MLFVNCTQHTERNNSNCKSTFACLAHCAMCSCTLCTLSLCLLCELFHCDYCELGHLSIMHLEHYTHCVWSFEPGTLWLMELSAAGRGLQPGACIYCTERYKCLHILYKVFAYIARRDTSVCVLHGVLAFIVQKDTSACIL